MSAFVHRAGRASGAGAGAVRCTSDEGELLVLEAVRLCTQLDISDI